MILWPVCFASAEVAVFATVASMREASPDEGVVLQTLGYHEPGDGGGAVYVVSDGDEAEREAADGLADHVLANGQVARIRVGGTFNPRMFGARGDGQTEDTAAFFSMDAAIERINRAVHVHIPDGEFIVNPLNAPLREMAPGKIRSANLITFRNDHSVLTCSGMIKIQPDVDYTVRAKDGPEWIGFEWFWSVVLIKANHCTIDGLKFDGNGTAFTAGWKGDTYQPRWGGVSAFGEWDNETCHIGNKVINCTILGGGGHGVGMQYQKQAIIANNYFEDTTGNGFSRSEDSVIIGNIAFRSHDAPYVINGRCYNIIVANNVSRDTTNGSGIDIVGADRILVQGNVIENSAAWGILVSYSAQQKVPSTDVVVTDNILIRNCRSLDTPINAEVCVGLPWRGPDGRINAKDIDVSGNKFAIDGTHGTDKGRFVVIGKGAEDVRVTGNTVRGAPNDTREIFAVTAPTRDLVVTDNVWLGDDVAEVIINTALGVEGQLLVNNNTNMSMSAGATAVRE